MTPDLFLEEVEKIAGCRDDKGFLKIIIFYEVITSGQNEIYMGFLFHAKNI